MNSITTDNLNDLTILGLNFYYYYKVKEIGQKYATVDHVHVTLIG